MSAAADIQIFPRDGSVEDFVEEFLLKNLPCLFDASFTDHWRSRQLWVDAQGQPNLDYLSKEYGMSHPYKLFYEKGSYCVHCVCAIR